MSEDEASNTSQEPNKSLTKRYLKMKHYIGIDVGKFELDVYDGACHCTYENTEKGITQMLNHLKKTYPKEDIFIAFEATGGYEEKVSRQLAAALIPFKRLHPNKVRHYGKALGYLAKTDKIDARLIRKFAQEQALEESDRLPDEKITELKGLLGRREQLLDEKTRETNRLDKLANPAVINSIKKHIDWIDEELKNLEKQIKEDVKKDEPIRQQVKLYESIKGIGILTATYLTAHLPELGKIENESLSSLVGLAPMNCDSGKKLGKRTVQAGRAQIRRVLYMAALSAIKFNPDIKEFYDRLKKKGKLFKVAITAAMRKLILVVNSVAKRGTPWQATRVSR